METLVAVIHIIVALVLIVLILVQDTKSGSIGGAFGGGGSGSVFGATGAATLAQKMTRWTAVVFAATCIMLTIFSSRGHRSVIDNVVTNQGAAAAPATTTQDGPVDLSTAVPADAPATGVPANTAPAATPAPAK